MTEEVTNAEITQNTDPVTENSITSSENVAPDAESAPEKTLPQSKVDEIVKTAKIDAYNKGKREILQNIENEKLAANMQNNAVASMVNTQQQYSNPANIQQDDIKKIVEQEINHRVMFQDASNIAQQFVQKMRTGSQKYSDFEEVVAPLNIGEVPNIVRVLNNFENCSDIMYEIGKNPSKFANILTLSAVSPNLAAIELNKLSASIKANEEAKKQQKQSQEPLSQVKTSITGTDSGDMSVSDLRKQKWLRN